MHVTAKPDHPVPAHLKPRSFLRKAQVLARTGLSKTVLYRLIAENKFPPQINLGGPRAVGWPEDEVDEWIETQVRNSRGPEPIRPAVGVRRAG
jgi:prophage regulatory protein